MNYIDHVAIARESAFETMKNTALEQLNIATVQDALGDDAERITKAIGKSELACLHSGSIMLDAESDAVAILPVIRDDPDYLLFNAQQGYPAKTLEKLTTVRDSSIDIRRVKNSRLGAAHFSQHQKQELNEDGSSYEVKHRKGLVVAKMNLAHAPAAVVAAVLGHEFDHAIRGNELVESLHKIFDEDPEAEIFEAQFLATSERYAYDITYKILTALGVKSATTVDRLCQIVGDMTPEQAGDHLRLSYGYCDYFNEYAEMLASISAGTLALSRVFGDEANKFATNDEAVAYEAAGIIYATL